MPQPNFVFIMTDTQGANMLGCYGRPELRTPNLDRLASEGVRFDRAFSNCPVCTPARGAIFTGLYPSFNGAWSNSLPLYDTMKTMGQRFRDAGYRTAYVGKWHLAGLDYFDSGICPDGWDDAYWYDGRRYMAELSDRELALWRTGLRDIDSLRKHDIRAEFTWGHRISDRGIRFLDENAGGGKPFLLVLSYDEPHGPETCPAEFVEPFLDYHWQIGPAAHDDLAGKPAAQRLLAQTAGTYAPSGTLYYPLYFGCNSFVDWEIGRVLDAIDRRAAENTWVIFTSDHGNFLGAHRLTGKGLAMYNEAARIPLIIREPGRPEGRWPTGVVEQTLAAHVDLLPTMLELASLPVPPLLQGRSLASLFAGFDLPNKDAFIEWHNFEVDHDTMVGFYPARCIVHGDWKLVINLLDTDELYNLREDPHELHNRIDDPSAASARDEAFDLLLWRMWTQRDPFRGMGWERRAWRPAGGNPYGGRGHRGRPADGYLPPYLHYDTGKPIA